MRAGLVQPVETVAGLACFDFRQVAAARSLLALLRSGVSVTRVGRSLRQLRDWLPEADQSLDWLVRLSAAGPRIVVRTPEGHLLEPTGQRLLEFEPVPEVSTLPLTTAAAEDDLFEQALRFEQRRQYAQAATLYRKLLQLEGPDPDLCFNLANVLYAMGQTQAAVERLRQTVELDPQYADAWNNLGAMLTETGELTAAIEALERALELDPLYADAHFGLADALEISGRHDKAQTHWQAYLKLETTGPWADYARQRLAERA
jgi:tetratricopeptide (TPR) repeat protein